VAQACDLAGAHPSFFEGWDLSPAALHAREFHPSDLFITFFSYRHHRPRTTIDANIARPCSIGKFAPSPETNPFPVIFPPLFDNIWQRRAPTRMQGVSLISSAFLSGLREFLSVFFVV